MKKIYLTISAIALAALGFAQNAKVAANAHNIQSLTNVVNHPASKVINNSVQAAGDTVWIFDGVFSYNWDGNLPATYSVALEDVDGLTITSTYTPYFGATGSYKFFYYQNPAQTDMHYGHADTVYYAAGTSWFATAGQADNWIEFGPIHVPAGGGTLKWSHTYIDKDYRDGYQVLVNTTGLAHTNFTASPIFTIADNDASTTADTANTPVKTWYGRSANVDAYAGQDIYIAVRHYAMDENIFEFTNMMLIDNGLTTGIANHANGVFIGTNVPNPANGSTTISYAVEKNSNVAFSVTDLTGKVVYTDNIGEVAAGTHNVNLNTASLSNGMYLYTFVINGHKETRKFVVANN
ncbi:MAG: T9SS type A sorting domain-containing protein [Bacteroidia bacterium]